MLSHLAVDVLAGHRVTSHEQLKLLGGALGKPAKTAGWKFREGGRSLDSKIYVEDQEEITKVSLEEHMRICCIR